MRQVLLQGFRLFAEQYLIGAPECGDGMRDRIVEAPVEGAKLVRGDVRFLFDRQIGNGLADVAVAVDHLVDAESEAQQVAPVQSRSAADFRRG